MLILWHCKVAGHERLICSDKLRKKKHGKSLKVDDTPCALDKFGIAALSFEKKGKQPPVFSELPGEDGQFSFAAQTSKFSEYGAS